jgi:hypothetical protein
VIFRVALAAALFVSIFFARLSTIPSDVYEARDDGVITLSHARNLVDYGFIGVSPSGERVEGFSAPLQFWVMSAAYAIGHLDYKTFLRYQMWIGTALLGAVFGALLLSGIAGQIEQRWRRFFILLAIPVCALLLTCSDRFLLWHASGMENVYKSVLLLALVGLLDWMLRTGRLSAWAVLVAVLASLSRTDAIVPVTILLVPFAVLWALVHRNAKGAAFVGFTVAPWLAYMVVRRWYFGQWEPNTAGAQNILVIARLERFLTSPQEAWLDVWDWMRLIGRELLGWQIAWLPVLLLIVRRDRTGLHRAVMLGAGALGCVAQYMLFGPARMDPARTVTELALYATAMVPFVLLARRDFGRRDFAAGGVMLGLSLTFAWSGPLPNGYFAWGAGVGERTANEIEEIARRYDVPRPMLANADLGAVSWRKDFNIVDLGRLGSGLIPRLQHPGRYVVDFLKPDIIELHDGWWPCVYPELYASDSFQKEYVPVHAAHTGWIASTCGGNDAIQSGVWIRRDIIQHSGTPERAFLDRFRSSLDVTSLNEELGRCLGQTGTRPCAYVGRTLFRFVPELKEEGLFETISTMLSRDPRLKPERAYFRSSVDSSWWRSIAEIVEPLSAAPTALTLTAVAGWPAAEAEVELRDPAESPWRIVNPEPDRVDVSPLTGNKSTTLKIGMRKGIPPSGATVALSIQSSSQQPAVRFPVHLRLLRKRPDSQPAGFVDIPSNPVRIEPVPMNFLGWASDEVHVARVFVAFVDASGHITKLGNAHAAGQRPDVSALFPEAHVVGWQFTLRPDALAGISLPATLHFYAESTDGRRGEIGQRTLH